VLVDELWFFSGVLAVVNGTKESWCCVGQCMLHASVHCAMYIIPLVMVTFGLKAVCLVCAGSTLDVWTVEYMTSLNGPLVSTAV